MRPSKFTPSVLAVIGIFQQPNGLCLRLHPPRRSARNSRTELRQPGLRARLRKIAVDTTSLLAVGQDHHAVFDATLRAHCACDKSWLIGLSHDTLCCLALIGYPFVGSSNGTSRTSYVSILEHANRCSPHSLCAVSIGSRGKPCQTALPSAAPFVHSRDIPLRWAVMS